MYVIPPDPSLIIAVEKLVWHPDPFQSLKIFGLKLTDKLYSSAHLCKRYLAAQR
jgi:hypothetical protein